MRGAAVPRWAVSFADLGLLLLGCFVLLHAMESARPKAVAAVGAPTRANADAWQAVELFEPGEARLTAQARDALAAIGRSSAAREVRIVSRGSAEGGNRLDRFELAAARTAAVGRALREAGVSERNLTVTMAEAGGAAAAQQIEIVHR